MTVPDGGAKMLLIERRYIAPPGIGLTLTDGKQLSMLSSEFGVPVRGSGPAR
jgi:hypothetical protein